MRQDLEMQNNEYLRQKKEYGNAERFIRNLRDSTFLGRSNKFCIHDTYLDEIKPKMEDI
jgi:hypothetical protein